MDRRRKAIESNGTANGGSMQRMVSPRSVIQMWVVEYEHNGRCWRTVIEHYSREEAKANFERENPNVRVRECY